MGSILKKTIGIAKKSPVLPFGSRLRNFYKKNIREKMYEDRKILVEIEGIKRILDLSTYAGMEAYFGNWEPVVAKAIKECVRPGMTVMDIGSSIGLHAFQLKKLVGREGKVFAIDAKKSAVDALKRTAELNNHSGADNFYLDDIMLSDETRAKEMRLDDFVVLKNLSRLDFVLMDLDGGEYRVVKGGMATLKKFKPTLALEIHSTHLGKEAAVKLIDLLSLVGYSFFETDSFKKYSGPAALVERVLEKKTLYILCKTN